MGDIPPALFYKYLNNKQITHPCPSQEGIGVRGGCNIIEVVEVAWIVKVVKVLRVLENLWNTNNID
jgi:hypothetical protein